MTGFGPFVEVRFTVLGDGIETTRTLGYVSLTPTRLPKTLGRAASVEPTAAGEFRQAFAWPK